MTLERLLAAAEKILDVDTGCGCCADFRAEEAARAELAAAIAEMKT